MKSRLTPEAEQDVDEAVGWYDQRGPDIGDAFLRNLHACIARIERHPSMYRVVHGRMRRALVEVFPYQVLYMVGRTEVVVHGVYHCARDPKSWRRRPLGG